MDPLLVNGCLWTASESLTVFLILKEAHCLLYLWQLKLLNFAFKLMMSRNNNKHLGWQTSVMIYGSLISTWDNVGWNTQIHMLIFFPCSLVLEELVYRTSSRHISTPIPLLMAKYLVFSLEVLGMTIGTYLDFTLVPWWLWLVPWCLHALGSRMRVGGRKRERSCFCDSGDHYSDFSSW